jgi:hypothetical protein
MNRKPLESSVRRDGRRSAGRGGILIVSALLAASHAPLGAQGSSSDPYGPPPRLPYRYPAAPLPAPAQQQAQPQPPHSADRAAETLDKAGQIAVQPVRDVGIAKASIPLVLQEAVQDPYKPLHRQNCAWVDYEMARLNQALGADFGASQKTNEDRTTELALLGGEMIVNSLIPFRGIVREISGAGPAERRKAAAVNAGLARRGYVRGVGVVLGCPGRVTTASR